MPEPSRMHDTTAVARLSGDAATVQRIANALAGSPMAEEIAVAAFEDASGRWSLAVHFRQRPDETAVRALIVSAAGIAVAQAVSFETLAPTDWVDKSREGLTPVEAGRFVVHGAHARERARINRIGIEIDAGLAFGTGHHGTTRGCLLALDRIIKERKPRPAGMAVLRCKSGRRTVALDIGTGTGVLAIAAAKVLRRPVLASDLDRRAVAIARDNARINRVAGAVEVIHATGLRAAAFSARGPYRLIFANILLEPLRGLATPIARLVAPRGQVVLSGLLTADADAALACYRARGLALVRRIRLEGWTALVLMRRAARRSMRRARSRG
jgi:ribosomal protein L11 methyltransferase